MQVGDLVRVFNERGLDEVGYIKRFGRLGDSFLIIYLSGSCVGQEQFFSEFNVLPIKQLTGEERA